MKYYYTLSSIHLAAGTKPMGTLFVYYVSVGTYFEVEQL